MSERKVHFSEPLTTIRYIHTWKTASRLARDGSDWMRLALDRSRFRDRVNRAATYLDEILDINHRNQIYQQRFVASSTDAQTQLLQSPPATSTTTSSLSTLAPVRTLSNEKTNDKDDNSNQDATIISNKHCSTNKSFMNPSERGQSTPNHKDNESSYNNTENIITDNKEIDNNIDISTLNYKNIEDGH